MKNLGMLMGIAAMFGSMGNTHTSGGEFVSDETPDQRKRRLDKAEIERNKANGLLEFDYGRGNTVYAINQKNANKKAKKLGYI